MNIGQAIQNALDHQRAGRFADARKIYLQVLEQDPKQPDALNLLGVLSSQMGDHDAAIQYLTRAINFRPNSAETQNNLGVVLGQVNRLDEAILAFRRAVELKPDYVAALLNLARLLKQKGRLDEALAALIRITQIDPRNFEAQFEIGIALIQIRRFAEAASALNRTVEINPQSYESLENLGYCLLQTSRPTEAIAACSRAVEIRPDLPEAHNNLGNTLSSDDRLDEALASYQRAVALNPEFTEAHVNLGVTLASVGRLDEAIREYRTAIALKPGYARAHSNLVYALNFHPDFDAKKIFAEARHFVAAHEKPLESEIKPHVNDPSPDRRLRVGYVSPDFRENVVGWNLLPLLQNHDHHAFEIICFSGVVRPDGMTQRLRACADGWHDVSGLGDSQVADLVRREKIDILVDLSLHMADNRLLTFARKPAPVQVTYLGYCGTTGLSAIDYRFSDPFMDPPETDLSLSSEQTVRLPRSYWCYSPPPAPTPSDSPSRSAGFVTFGCLNNFSKVSPAALSLWIQILQKIEGSRLILHADPGDHRRIIRDRFSQAAISPDRLEFVGRESWENYMLTHDRVDIALDPFPHGGGITTCDSLWMGVPVVTLKGGTAVGRGGVSILSNIGLPEFVAQTPAEYVRIAIDLAADLTRRIELRRTLRTRMQNSPLMDSRSFAIDVEHAYRQMFKTWCARPA